MKEQKIDLKCLGCNCKLPKIQFNIENQKPSYYAAYIGCIMIEWICATCWDNGVRYKYNEESKVSK